MLETIREFASGHFAETHEADELRTRHAEYYRDLALSASLDTDVPGEQEPAIVILDVANLRAALGWALERDEIVFGLELLVALEQLWTLGYTAEGMRWYAAFLERGDEAAPLLRAARFDRSAARRTLPASSTSRRNCGRRASRSTSVSKTITGLQCSCTDSRSGRSSAAMPSVRVTSVNEAWSFTGGARTTKVRVSRWPCSARLHCRPATRRQVSHCSRRVPTSLRAFPGAGGVQEL